jgi:hypothetical protein
VELLLVAGRVVDAAKVDLAVKSEPLDERGEPRPIAVAGVRVLPERIHLGGEDRQPAEHPAPVAIQVAAQAPRPSVSANVVTSRQMPLDVVQGESVAVRSGPDLDGGACVDEPVGPEVERPLVGYAAARR